MLASGQHRQHCKQLLLPVGVDLTPPSARAQPFALKGSIEGCQQQWGVTPRPMWATIAWGGKRIETASNIVFTNGLLDPWCMGWWFLGSWVDPGLSRFGKVRG